MRPRRMLILGDSHLIAIKSALENSYLLNLFKVDCFQIQKLKNNKVYGDKSFDELINLATSYQDDDIIVCVLGGNQHQMLSLVQHPVVFDFFSEDSSVSTNIDCQIIPRAQVIDLIQSTLNVKDITRLKKLRRVSDCKFLQICPPPPKQHLSHIKKFEQGFREKGILEFGISPDSLRIKFFHEQVKLLASISNEVGCQLIYPPDLAVTTEGFLAQNYYANDASHANMAYGALILEQIERVTHLI